MKCLFVCLAVFFMVAPAMAGEDPYIAIVGNDMTAANPFYFSPKYAQFMFDQTVLGVPICFTGSAPQAADTNFSFLRPINGIGGPGCESFFAQGPTNQPEVCDTAGTAGPGCTPPFTFRGNPNARVTAGNAGFFEWWIRLPKKPSGEINLVIQCGVLKPNTFAGECFNAIELCAAETGERIGVGFCTRQEVDPGVSPVNNTALPQLTAVAYPGPFNSFTPFHLTAFKNASSYALSFDPVTGAMSNNTNSQVLGAQTVPGVDEVWNFFGPQAPFPNAPTTPAVPVGSGAVTVTNADGFKVTLTPYSIAPTNPTATNGTIGQLTGRNQGPGSDEQGAGVGPGPYLEANSTTFEINGTEAIRIDFTDFANIPGAASEHLFFNSLTTDPGAPVEIAHIWQDCVGCTSLGTIVHNPAMFPAPEDFSIPPSAFGHPIFVKADTADFLLYGVSVDTVVTIRTNTRILLKSCMDKPVVTKLPVTGQINALAETETDLEAGDMIQVRLDIPRQNTVDIYCNAQSARLAGVGESPF
ncbi:MAG: hypothetical protein L7F78_01135 [Syntrophales bacterium LBB04]|nr:hypothetical protein [Syntrophales bacterium LBB04]